MSTITVSVLVNASPADVWEKWTQPQHITQWNFASEDWTCPSASNDLRVGGSFTSRMEAKDGSAGFDFGGIYTEVHPLSLIEYTLEDGRTVSIQFEPGEEGVKVTERFTPDDVYSTEQQAAGWQAILENFKYYVEASS